jgi:hypothetical protein
MSALRKVTTTGNVLPSGSCYLQGVVFNPGNTASTLDLRLDGSGGTVVLSMTAPANSASLIWQAFDRPGVGAAQLHATLAGTGASACFETT